MYNLNITSDRVLLNLLPKSDSVLFSWLKSKYENAGFIAVILYKILSFMLKNEKLNKVNLNPIINFLTYCETYPSCSSKNCNILICPKTIQSTVIEDKLNAVRPDVNRRTTPMTTRLTMLYVSIWELSYWLYFWIKINLLICWWAWGRGTSWGRTRRRTSL